MQQNNLVKICPECSCPNTINSRRCVECGKNLAGVKSEPTFQVQPAVPDAALPSTSPLNEFDATEGQRTLPLDETPSAGKVHSPFVKTISLTKAKLGHNHRGFVIVALLLVLLAILLPLVILLPRLRSNGGTIQGKGTPAATPTPVPLHLPTGLGEVVTPADQLVGVNDGSFAPFDISGVSQEMTLKQQAATAMKNGDTQGAISLWRQALSLKSNDAEALIYLEDQHVLVSGMPYVTLVAATAFTSPFPDGQYESYLQGIYVAQHEFNTGNHAFLLRILIANSGSNVKENNTPSVAQQIVQIAQKDTTVVGVIGWLNSSHTLDALKTFSNAKLTMISPQASSDELTGISPYFFRIVGPNKMQTQAAVQFMKNILHVNHPVVFVDPHDAYSQNLAQDFETVFSATGHLPEETFKTDNIRNFSGLMQDALNRYHPDALYFTSPSSVDAGHFQDALPTTGEYARIPAMGGDGSYSIQPNSHGRWYFTEYAYHGESNLPVALQFAQEYTQDFDPGPHPQEHAGYYGYSLANDHAILTYDATSVVLAALVAQNSAGNTKLTPQSLANGLAAIKGANAFQGVSGQIAFGPDHDPINKAVVILYASKDGHTVLYNIEGCVVKGCP